MITKIGIWYVGGVGIDCVGGSGLRMAEMSLPSESTCSGERPGTD